METSYDHIINKASKVVASYEALEKIVDGYKAQGKTIALTSGTYDMLHDGHVKYLLIARSMADVLIIGLDSDARARKEKGEDRPFDKLETRALILSVFEPINHIMVVEPDDGKRKLFEVVRPDIIIISESSLGTQSYHAGKEHKGNFYQRMVKAYVDTGIAKKVIELPGQSANSTTDKMRRLRKEGSKEVLGKIKNVHANYSEEVKELTKKIAQLQEDYGINIAAITEEFFETDRKDQNSTGHE